MFIEANQPDDGSVFESDVCLVGAGAAGITLARAFAEKGKSVSLLESGGFKYEAPTQKLSSGVNIGAQYPMEFARLRYFGGSTNHWGGQSHRLYDYDFEPQPWIEGSGWPIRKSDLDPYYDRALGIIDIAPGYERFEDLEKDTDAYPRLLGRDNQIFESLVWIKSPPTRMGPKYRPEIKSSERIRCYLHANAVDLITDADARAIVRLEAKTLQGRRLTFKSRIYILCGGAIENARLLLLSDSVAPGGIGNQHDLVGRYFSEHAGERFVDRMLLAIPHDKKGFQEEYLLNRAKKGGMPVSAFHFGFAATRATREKHKLLGFSVNAQRIGEPDPDSIDGAVAELLANPTASTRGGTAVRRVFSYMMWIIAEQAPNPNNRIFLSDEKDALGLRKTTLDWRAYPIDKQSMLDGLRLFALELAKSGNGRIRMPQLEDFKLMDNVIMAGHQLGTTRMADDPRHGVTDANGKVHGVDNLYVAGNSLFPTTGFVNPTLTLIALALRTADHITKLDQTG